LKDSYTFNKKTCLVDLENPNSTLLEIRMLMYCLKLNQFIKCFGKSKNQEEQVVNLLKKAAENGGITSFQLIMSIVMIKTQTDTLGDLVCCKELFNRLCSIPMW
jgi:hypothetical protein